MYLFEKGIWETGIESPVKRAKEEENIRKVLGEEALRDSKASPMSEALGGKEWRATDRVDVSPVHAHAIYAFNDRYLDVRASWQEEKRGLVTFLFLGFFVFLLTWQFGRMALLSLEGIVSGVGPLGTMYGPGDYVALLLMILLWAGGNFLFFKFFWRWIRLELFTQRHIIARFNRVTRQVHLNRPKCAGGIVTLPWDSTMAAIDPDLPDREGIGAQLLLVWPMEYSGAGYDEMLFLGEPMDGNRQVLGLWEYIRRYMEDGPQAVPAPKRLRPIFPWPWDSVRSTLSFLAPMWRRGAKGYALVAGLLLSPLMLLHAACHWLSLLLCWPASWPKVITEAGLPGKSVPKLTVAEDHGEEVGGYLRANSAQSREDVSSRRGGRERTKPQQVETDV